MRGNGPSAVDGIDTFNYQLFETNNFRIRRRREFFRRRPFFVWVVRVGSYGGLTPATRRTRTDPNTFSGRGRYGRPRGASQGPTPSKPELTPSPEYITLGVDSGPRGTAVSRTTDRPPSPGKKSPFINPMRRTTFVFGDVRFFFGDVPPQLG